MSHNVQAREDIMTLQDALLILCDDTTVLSPAMMDMDLVSSTWAAAEDKGPLTRSDSL